MFPNLSNDILMRQAVADKTEIRFMEQSNGTVVCSYVVAAEGTFDCPFSREARGVVFKDGRIISRPLHKFFNLNERPESRVDALPWDEMTRVMVKRDGSMIHTVDMFDMSRNRLYKLKSKKSFESDVVKATYKWLDSDPDIRHRYDSLCEHVVSLGMTAIFEWTSPTSRIVLAYQEPSLDLLHVRDNVTGRYMTYEELYDLHRTFEVPLVQEDVEARAILFGDEADHVVDAEVIDLLASKTGVEGWVIQFKSGEMVKLKTKDYIERHKYMTFLRVRDIAEAVVGEQLDDLKGKLVGEGVDISEILKIEAEVVARIDKIIEDVEKTYEASKALDKKSFAIKHKDGYPYFGLLMKRYSGQEPDYKGYFLKHHLDEYPLEQLNLVQTNAEAE